jgi:putative transposase
MHFREVSVMDERREFVRLAAQDGVNRRELCRRFGISADTGYKWLSRWQDGDDKLADRSRRPLTSPDRSSEATEAAVLEVRDAHPAWGARKIVSHLARAGTAVPAISTAHAILGRHGRIGSPEQTAHPFRRFERSTPNELWQMDFKGRIEVGRATICHPLTIVDDHSRYSPCISACADQQGLTVQSRLTVTFRRYGLPDAFFLDNGSPWGDGEARWTRLKVWLLKLGVGVINSRPYHPQGRGKNERFHRTLKAEVLAMRRYRDLVELQDAFDAWRDIYNLERPHEGIGMQVPADRYRPSPRAMPDRLPEVQYGSGETVRRVSTTKDYISFKGRLWSVPRAFRGELLAIRPLTADGHYGIFFGSWPIATIDLTMPKSVSDVPEQVSAMSPV